MSLEMAVLGFLSWKPQSGYDLKKNFTSVEFIPWSGNNNQIYKTLLKLDEEGLVDSSLDQSKSGPVRKIYTISRKGQTALKTALLAEPETEQVKNVFLIQLAFSELLETRLVLNLLDDYDRLLQEKILILREEQNRKKGSPLRSGREKIIWESIGQRKINALELDREWVQSLKSKLELQNE